MIVSLATLRRSFGSRGINPVILPFPALPNAVLLQCQLPDLVPDLDDKGLLIIYVPDSEHVPLEQPSVLEELLIKKGGVGIDTLLLLVSSFPAGTHVRIRPRWVVRSLRDLAAALDSEEDELHTFVTRTFAPRLLHTYQSIRVVDGSMFFGRSDELSDLCESSNSYAVIGARRVGKSSVAKEVQKHLKRARTYTHAVDSSVAIQPGKQWYSVCNVDLTEPDILEKIWERLLEEMGFPLNLIKPGARYRLNLVDKKEWKQERSTYEILYRILKSTRVPAAFLFDEVDSAIVRDRASHYGMFKQLQVLAHDRECNVRVVLFGYEELNRAWKSADFPLNQGRLKQKELGPLGPDEVRALIEIPMSRIGIKVEASNQVRDAVHRATGGMPNLVQDLCAAVLERASVNETRVLTPRDVQETMDDRAFVTRLDYQFDQVKEDLPRLVAYLMAVKREFTLEIVLSALEAYPQVLVSDAEVRDALQQLTLYSVLELVGGLDEYIFASTRLRDRIRQVLGQDKQNTRINALVRKLAARRLSGS